MTRLQHDKVELSDAEKHRRALALKDRIIRKLQAADRVYAEQIQGFKGSLHALSRTPEATQILHQYHAGDKRAALLALEVLIEVRQQLRQAAAQSFYIADLRAQAALVLDAADKGEVELAYAVTKLEALTTEETENWRMWLALFRFYFSDAQYEQARRCLGEASRILDRKETFEKIFAGFADLEMKIHDIRARVAAQGITLTRPEEFQRHHLNYIISIESEEAEALIIMPVMGESLETIGARPEVCTKQPRSAFESALIAQPGSESGGIICVALADAPARARGGVGGLGDPDRPRDSFLNFALDDAVREACQKHRQKPTVALYARHLAFVFERLGHLYYEVNDRPMAGLLYAEANAIDRALLAEHSASLDLRRNLATSLFNLALVEASPPRWQQACAYLETMHGEGRLMRRDQSFRHSACQYAMRTGAP